MRMPEATTKKPEIPVSTMRHSGAHLMALAIYRLYPGAKFGVGPDITNGFYYDIRLPENLKEEDFAKIEEEMKSLRKQRLPYKKMVLPIDDAIKFMQERGQTYKVDLLTLLKEKGSTAVSQETGDDNVAETTSTGAQEVSFYQVGEFIDLCRGPHVEHTGQVGHFKLNSIAAAYWRGKAENDALQRFYALAYPTKEELQQEEKRLREIKERDHRTIGAQQGLFFFSPLEIGPGLTFWDNPGWVMQKELEKLSHEEERKDGYYYVATPELAKESVYLKSGHLPYYKEDMYAPIQIEGESYYLRPMNCPHHHEVFNHRVRSYKELPFRVAEHGKVFRFESSGALSGLLRTRGFRQNDSHIYCTKDQAKATFIEVMNLHARLYKIFDIKDFYMRLSLPDMDKLGKYVNDVEGWKEALAIVYEAMKDSGLEYKEAKGEAAFYGPKIDFQIFNAAGAEYSISTNQLDFLARTRFNLQYQGPNSELKNDVFVVHRTPLGSHERFIAFLIEHYKGAYPTWLSPLQVKIIAVHADYESYAQQVCEFLFNAKVDTATQGLRVKVDESDNTLNKKIRNAQLEHVPYVLVVGEREAKDQTVTVRLRTGEQFTLSLDDFLKRIKYEIETRSDFTRTKDVIFPEEKKYNFSQFLVSRGQPETQSVSVDVQAKASEQSIVNNNNLGFGK